MEQEDKGLHPSPGSRLIEGGQGGIGVEESTHKKLHTP